MKKIIFYVILLFAVCSCAGTKKNRRVEIPNGVQISETLFCDKTEVSNIDWKEYMFWLKKVHGEKSKEYLLGLPDTTVWIQVDSCLSILTNQYFQDPAFTHYPLVGITQRQALNYSKWRSDRVYEMMLIKQGIINPRPQNRDTFFTIEKFLQGNWPTVIIKDKVIELYPEFRLPAFAERRAILAFARGKDVSLVKPWCNIIPCTNKKLKLNPTGDVLSTTSKTKAQIIFHLQGNISEWSSEKNISFGCSWHHINDNNISTDTFYANRPNAWTGFRNVSEWKSVETLIK
jgi:hypothetical protein